MDRSFLGYKSLVSSFLFYNISRSNRERIRKAKRKNGENINDELDGTRVEKGSAVKDGIPARSFLTDSARMSSCHKNGRQPYGRMSFCFIVPNFITLSNGLDSKEP